MRFRAVQMLSELMLSDMAHQADMGPGGLHRLVTIHGAEMAAVPGAAEQRRKVTLLPREHVEDRGELLGEHEEAAIGDRLFITQSMDEAASRQTGGGDAVGDPKVIDFGKEAADLAPAGSLAGLAGFAYQDDEEVETVTCGLNRTVRARPDEVAESGEKLQENRGWIGFGVRRDGADDRSGDTVERLRGKAGPGGIAERRWVWGCDWGSGRGRLLRLKIKLAAD
jgi:hypothetical protein